MLQFFCCWNTKLFLNQLPLFTAARETKIFFRHALSTKFLHVAEGMQRSARKKNSLFAHEKYPSCTSAYFILFWVLCFLWMNDVIVVDLSDCQTNYKKKIVLLYMDDLVLYILVWSFYDPCLKSNTSSNTPSLYHFHYFPLSHLEEG